MGCCASSLKLDMTRSLDGSICASKRSRSGSSASSTRSTPSGSAINTNNNNNANNASNSSGVGSTCSTPQRNRSIWSRSQVTRPICDDFAEHPSQLLDRSCGYHTCSSDASTPSNYQLRRTQDMENNTTHSTVDDDDDDVVRVGVGNLEWEMYMMQHAQRIMCKTSSPIGQRRSHMGPHDPNSRSYHKWRNYLQTTPLHMLHNVSHIPEAVAGQFCPTDYPAFTDLEEMENVAKRYKVDTGAAQQLTHTISTEL